MAAVTEPALRGREDSHRKYRRGSAGGQALHRWQRQGKLTTIHIVYELDAPIKEAQLVALVDERLLMRFPRFRGFLSDDERHWIVPEKVDAREYVQPVELLASPGSVESAVCQHVELQLDKDLPARQTWEAQLINVSGHDGCFILWRICHTVADGVILSQIMSSVLCEPQSRALCEPDLCAAGASKPSNTVAPQQLKATTVEVSSSTKRVRQSASICERLWRFIGGVCFCACLIVWPSDTHTVLQLGPKRWRKLASATHNSPQRPSTAGTDGNATDACSASTEPATNRSTNGHMHSSLGSTSTRVRARLRMGVAVPIKVGLLKKAAKACGVTVNDLLMCGLAGGIRTYLMQRGETAPANLRVTAIAVINPRPVMPQAGVGSTEALLQHYASMRGPGCDITLGILPLPCGELTVSERRKRVAASTRRLKLSPETILLRFAATWMVTLFGVGALICVYAQILAKFTTYVSNVVAPDTAGALCGIRIRRIFFCTSPLDFGASFSFLSYDGECTLCTTGNIAAVPDPQTLAEHVRASIMEQVEESTSADEPPSVPPTDP